MKKNFDFFTNFSAAGAEAEKNPAFQVAGD